MPLRSICARPNRWPARLDRLLDLRVLRDDARAHAAACPVQDWATALAALDAELAADTRAYLAVHSRLSALVSAYNQGSAARLVV